MSTVGIVGGLGPESTIDYYRRILELWHETQPDSSPSVLIDSLDVNLGIDMVAGLPVLDTTELHVRAIVDRLKSGLSSHAT